MVPDIYTCPSRKKECTSSSWGYSKKNISGTIANSQRRPTEKNKNGAIANIRLSVEPVTLQRSNRPEVFCKKGDLKNFAKFTGKQLCQSLFFNQVAGLRKKKILAQVFACEFCEISKNTFFTEHLWWLLLNVRHLQTFSLISSEMPILLFVPCRWYFSCL